MPDLDGLIASIGTRAGALKTDDEYRADFAALTNLTTERDDRKRLDAALAERAAKRAAVNAEYKRAKPDAQKGRI